MATVDIPQILEQIRSYSEKQFNLLEKQAQLGKQTYAQTHAQQQRAQAGDAAWSFAGSIGSTIRSIMPPGIQRAASAAGGVVAAGRAGLKAITSARAAVAAGGQVSGLAGALAIPGVGEAIVGVGTAFMAIKVAVVDLPQAIMSWTQSLLDSQRAMARYSPELASVFLTFDAAQMARERTFGSATAGSTGELAESMSAIQDALLPIRVAVTNIENKIGTTLLDLLTDLLETISDLLGIADNMQERPSGLNAFKEAAADLEKAHRRRGNIGEVPFARRP